MTNYLLTYFKHNQLIKTHSSLNGHVSLKIQLHQSKCGIMISMANLQITELTW